MKKCLLKTKFDNNRLTIFSLLLNNLLWRNFRFLLKITSNFFNPNKTREPMKLKKYVNKFYNQKKNMTNSVISRNYLLKLLKILFIFITINRIKISLNWRKRFRTWKIKFCLKNIPI